MRRGEDVGIRCEMLGDPRHREWAATAMQHQHRPAAPLLVHRNLDSRHHPVAHTAHHINILIYAYLYQHVYMSRADRYGASCQSIFKSSVATSSGPNTANTAPLTPR